MVPRIGYGPVMQGEIGQDGVLRLQQKTRRPLGRYSRVDATRIGNECSTARPEDGAHILLSKLGLKLLSSIRLCTKGAAFIVRARDIDVGAAFTIHVRQVHE